MSWQSCGNYLKKSLLFCIGNNKLIQSKRDSFFLVVAFNKKKLVEKFEKSVNMYSGFQIIKKV